MSVRLCFLILAHDRPGDAAELARTLVAAASDATAYIHFDVRAAPESFAALRAAVAGEPRVRLVEKRAAGAWGSFGLVEAPLNAVAQVEADGVEPDYVMLLSGACLPCRPVASLERFLKERDGGEFIESEDERWITGGWRSERWRFWHWFDHKTQHPQEWLSARIQKWLRVRRQFPAGLEPRFGSQWWTLTWPLLQAILADIRRQPKRLDFFRTVWIPDEMVFQTYVNALVPREAIAGFALTHFQFTNRGKPIVFHEDHAAYVKTLDRFFFRKVSPEATRLRAACLKLASAPDDGADSRPDRLAPRRLQAEGRRPDQLSRAGTAVLSRPVLRHDRPGAGPGDRSLRGAGRPAGADRAAGRRIGRRTGRRRIRLHRVRRGLRRRRGRSRAGPRQLPRAAPRRRGDPRHAPGALAGAAAGAQPGGAGDRLVAADPAPAARRGGARSPGAGGRAAAVLGGSDRDRATLRLHCLPAETRRAAGPLGVAPDRLQAVIADRAGSSSPDMASWLVSGVPPAGEAGLRAPDIVLPWGGDDAPGLRARRREALAAALEACRFRDAAWFPGLAAVLVRTGERFAAPGAIPGPPAGPAPEPSVLEDAS